ncbi:MAG: Holliday junction branch migration protein RuvA [Alphaproteobacteria bacterium]|nr:Holliday junction branch migration protein RuvA [Alphaproteobacteria bacterium]
MIGKLSGIIDSFDSSYLILDVSGVGYLIYTSNRTLSRIGQPGDAASLLIDTHVREDHIHLFGFADIAEQQWFRLLTSVQGVGAKVGLAILGVCPAEKLALIIASQDKAAIMQADGVGAKLGVRILTELKDKAGKIDLGISQVNTGKHEKIINEAQEQSFDQDAVSALINLGYARSEAYQAVMNAKKNANDNLQDIIRFALKELST